MQTKFDPQLSRLDAFWLLRTLQYDPANTWRMPASRCFVQLRREVCGLSLYSRLTLMDLVGLAYGLSADQSLE